MFNIIMHMIVTYLFMCFWKLCISNIFIYYYLVIVNYFCLMISDFILALCLGRNLRG